MNKRTWYLMSLVTVFALLLVACGPSATEPPTEAMTEEPTEAMTEEPTEAMTEEPTEAMTEEPAGIDCMGAQPGDEVTILYQWSGAEEESFSAAVAPVVEACGITIVPESSRDNAIIQTRVESGNPWDIVIWPNRGPTLSYSDMLQPLDTVGGDASNYAPALVAAGTIGSDWLAIPVKVDPKSMIWYSPANFEAKGYSVPTTFDELDSLVEQMVADGNTPWSMGFESGGATGWTGTDFIQDILLATQGADYVAGLISGSIPYNDPGVAAAFEIYLKWATDPAYTVGGADGTLSTGFLDAIYKPFADPPEAMMVKQSGFAGGVVADQYPELVQGEDYDFFPFPGADGVQIGADFMVVFNSSPAVQAVVAYLTSAEGGKHWAQLGFGFTPNLGASPADYPETQTKLAELLASGAGSPDLGDAIQPTFGQAEFDLMAALVGGTTTLEDGLAAVTAAQTDDLSQ